MAISDLAKAVIDFLHGKRGEVELGRICSAFPAYDQASVIAALREIEASGSGRLVLGRGGYKTRFIPAFTNGANAGDGGAVLKPVPEDAEHVFVLRRDPIVRVAVPSDLTFQEAERLSAWVKALAVE